MKRLILSALFGMLAVATAPCLHAQYHDLDLPLDSVAWWTLSDELTPETFRETYRSPLANLKRYFSDVNIDRADPLSQHRGQILAFYINAKSTPTLIPFWVAFNRLANEAPRPADGPAATTQQLLEVGISDSGARTILATVERLRDLREETTNPELNRPKNSEFQPFEELLPELRQELTESDWESLCAFLLSKVVAGMEPMCVLEHSLPGRNPRGCKTRDS